MRKGCQWVASWSPGSDTQKSGQQRSGCVPWGDRRPDVDLQVQGWGQRAPVGLRAVRASRA